MNANDELNFAYKLKAALDENLEHLPAPHAKRLAAARQAALARKKPDAPASIKVSQQVLASGSRFLGEHISWLHRMGLAIPLLVLALGMVGIYEFEDQQRIAELAEIDAEVLADELPLSAYLDNGFNAYLAQPGE